MVFFGVCFILTFLSIVFGKTYIWVRVDRNVKTVDGPFKQYYFPYHYFPSRLTWKVKKGPDVEHRNIPRYPQLAASEHRESHWNHACSTKNREVVSCYDQALTSPMYGRFAYNCHPNHQHAGKPMYIDMLALMV